MRHKHPLGMARQRRKFTRKPGEGGGAAGNGHHDHNRHDHDHNRQDHRRGGGHRHDNAPRETGDSVSPRQRQHARNAREKYLGLAQNAVREGDRVQAEYYFQHADHYTRILNLAQEQYDSRPPEQRQSGSQEQDEDTSEAAGARHAQEEIVPLPDTFSQ